jgi:Zn finger protein HypA/HybF involved in hydrogenase expression
MFEKKCFKCGETKQLSDFYRHSKMKDGHVNKCKECNKSDVSANYRKNIDHYKAYEKSRANLPHRVKARKDYSNSEAGLEAGKIARKAWVERNAIKKGASTMVRNAVRNGKLIRPSHCSDCECEHNRLHGHHDDYSKPLDVRWLCPTCHKQWHKINGAGLNG